MRRLLGVLLCAAALAVSGARAAADCVIFTPVHLCEQAKSILLIRFDKPDTPGRVTAKVIETLKGKDAPKTLTFNLTKAGKPGMADAAAKLIAAQGAEPAIGFASPNERWFEGMEQEQPNMLLVHVAAQWLDCYPSKDGRVQEFARLDTPMQATWAGGTDMLIRCVRFVLSTPEPYVATSVGVRWDEDSKTKIATVPGRILRLTAVDLAGDGKTALHVASSAGDRLFVWQKGEKPFKDVTAERGLTSKSRAAAWADFNGDRRGALVSWDGAALTLHVQGADGRFTARRIETGDALKGDTVSLAALDVGVKGRAGLVAATPAAIALLVPQDETFKVRPLTVEPALTKDLGPGGPVLVADFDGDNLADVLWLHAKGSILYRGSGGGPEVKPERKDIALGEPPGDAGVGDFDQDGRFDVFVVAADRPRLYQNRGGLRFEEVLDTSGEIAYISRPGAIGCQVCDVNNDGLQDLSLWYPPKSGETPLIFFNVGFRSLAHAHDLDLNELQILEEARDGQQACLVADLDGDGAPDYVVAVPDGGVWALLRKNIGDDPPLAVRAVLPLGGDFAGPLTVTASADKRFLGAWNVVAGSSEAVVGRREPGPIELRWQFPGRWQFPPTQPQKTEATLVDKPKRLILEPPKPTP